MPHHRVIECQHGIDLLIGEMHELVLGLRFGATVAQVAADRGDRYVGALTSPSTRQTIVVPDNRARHYGAPSLSPGSGPSGTAPFGAGSIETGIRRRRPQTHGVVS